MTRRNQRGHAMLELAISAGVMVACLGGTFQFGYTFYVYNQLVSAVGDGARYASARPRTPDEESSKAAIRNMVVYADSKPSPDATAVVRGLKPEQVDVQFTDGAVRVGIKDFKIDAVFAQFEFSGKPVVEFPYIGGAQ